MFFNRTRRSWYGEKGEVGQARMRVTVALALMHGGRLAGLPLAAANSYGDRVAGAAALWEFDRFDCFAGTFPNAGAAALFGALARNGSGEVGGGPDAVTSCLNGRGVRPLPGLPARTGVVLSSLRDGHELADAMGGADGLTFELWAGFGEGSRFANSSGSISPILTMGQGQGGGAAHWCLDDAPQLSMNLQLWANGDNLMVRPQAWSRSTSHHPHPQRPGSTGQIGHRSVFFLLGAFCCRLLLC